MKISSHSIKAAGILFLFGIILGVLHAIIVQWNLPISLHKIRTAHLDALPGSICAFVVIFSYQQMENRSHANLVMPTCVFSFYTLTASNLLAAIYGVENIVLYRDGTTQPLSILTVLIFVIPTLIWSSVWVHDLFRYWTPKLNLKDE